MAKTAKITKADGWLVTGLDSWAKMLDKCGAAIPARFLRESFPAEFHAQTAVECAMQLYSQVRDRLDDIERIVIETQEAAVRIIDKTGPLDKRRTWARVSANSASDRRAPVRRRRSRR